MGVNFDTVFKAFKENQTATIMTLLVIAISAMFTIHLNSDSGLKDEIKNCRIEAKANAYTCKIENDQMRDKMVEVLGALKEVQGEMNTLKKLGIIK